MYPSCTGIGSAPLRGQALVDADMPPVNMTTSLLSVGGPVDRSLCE